MDAPETIPSTDAIVLPHFRHERTRSVPQKRVLLAEDDNDLRLVMECVLISMGHHVVACADAFAAITAFRKRPGFDLLVTDLEMPGMSGLQLAREVTAERLELPVLLVTASFLTVAQVKELVYRGWSYMAKPCDIDSLKKTVHRLANQEKRVKRLDD